MINRPGDAIVIAPISVPGDANAAVRAASVLGGYVAVADTTERDAIPATSRKQGMMARTNDGTRYVLGAGLTNTDWTIEKQIEIDVTSQPWGVKADNSTDNSAAFAALLAYSKAQVALGYGVMWLLPSGYMRMSAPLELHPYISMRGMGTWTTAFYFISSTPIHGLWCRGQLNGSGGLYTTYSEFLVINSTNGWHLAGGSPQFWLPSHDYSSTPLGTYIRPARVSNRLLKLVSRGTSGAYRPIGQLWCSDQGMMLVGTANAAHVTIVKCVRGTYFGPSGAQFQISTDGGVTWGATLSTTDADANTFMIPALGSDFGVKIGNGIWGVVGSTTTTVSFTQPAIFGTVSGVSFAAISGLIVKTSYITIANAGLYEIVAVNVDDGNADIRLIVSYASGTIASGKTVSYVAAPTPRVEVLSAPTVTEDIIDLQMGGGLLGDAIFGYRHGVLNAKPWNYTSAGFTTYGPTTGLGAAYTDIMVSGMTLRFHSGVYSNSQGEIKYRTPSFGWSMEIGTTIVDGGNTWEVCESPDAVRLDTAGFCRFDSVATTGGNCGFAMRQCQCMEIGGKYYSSGFSLAGIWLSNGDMTYGEGPQFGNAVRIGGSCVFYGDGFGFLDDGGFGHIMDGNVAFQLCSAGWAQMCGLYGARIAPSYIETTGGRLTNSTYCSRYEGIQAIQMMDLTTGYAGSIGGDYFLDCYGATFEFHGVHGGGAIAAFGGLNTCNVRGSGRHHTGQLTDFAPYYGEVFDLATATLYRGGNLEVGRNINYTALNIANGSHAGAQFGSTNVILTGQTAAMTFRGIDSGSGIKDGRRLRLLIINGQWLTVTNNDAAALAANRILTQSGEDFLLPPGAYSFIDFMYNGIAGNQASWVITGSSPTKQQGVTTLVAGVSPAIPAGLKATSRIFVTQRAPSGTSLTVQYSPLPVDRVAGTPGSFKITALLAAGTINTADTSTLEWLVENP